MEALQLGPAAWPCSFTPKHSLTGPVGQPFASHLGRQRCMFWGCTYLTMEPGSPVSNVSLHNGFKLLLVHFITFIYPFMSSLEHLNLQQSLKYLYMISYSSFFLSGSPLFPYLHHNASCNKFQLQFRNIWNSKLSV